MLRIPAAVSAFILLMATSAQAAPVEFTATLLGQTKCHPFVPPAPAMRMSSLIPTAHTLQVNLTFSGLSGPHHRISHPLLHGLAVSNHATQRSGRDPDTHFPRFSLGRDQRRLQHVTFDLTLRAARIPLSSPLMAVRRPGGSRLRCRFVWKQDLSECPQHAVPRRRNSRLPGLCARTANPVAVRRRPGWCGGAQAQAPDADRRLMFSRLSLRKARTMRSAVL